jgi:hypothetical protein
VQAQAMHDMQYASLLSIEIASRSSSRAPEKREQPQLSISKNFYTHLLCVACVTTTTTTVTLCDVMLFTFILLFLYIHCVHAGPCNI